MELRNDLNLYPNSPQPFVDMEIVVISAPQEQPNEIEEVVRMFDAGLKHFHIRKPRMNKNQLAEYIKRYPEQFRSRMIIHSYHGLADTYQLGGIHLSREHRKRGKFYQLRLWIKRKFNPQLVVTRTFHKLTDVTSERRKYSYAFLSPVFDSVTRSSLAGGFSKRALLIIIPQARQPIYALGGVTVERLYECAENGFHGAAFHGSVWEGDITAAQTFIHAKEVAREIAKNR